MKNVKRLAFLYLSRIATRSRRFGHCRGQTLVEYALILSIISIVLVGVIVNLGHQITPVYSVVVSQLAAAESSH
ncbi:MAG: hypothetical protein LV479_11045 [Methylacidiphilales bacterium]|nr:hypothetical protein [Candidatus Methylacidiphilales bacterium]